MAGVRLLIVDALVLGGVAGLTLAVVGVVRLRDAFAKVHAASTAVVLGVALVLLAAIVGGGNAVAARALLVGGFLLLTAPVSTHALVRLTRLDRERRGGSKT